MMASGKVKRIDVAATVTRLGGTIEDLGIIARYRAPRPWLWLGLAMLCALGAWLIPQLCALLGLLGATLLVNGGRAVITNLVGVLGGTAPKFVAWGTGAGTTATTDTTLFTESAEARTSGTVTRTNTLTTNDTLQVSGAITATAGRTITNAALFDQLAVGGNMFIKTDFTGIVLASGEAITFTFQAQFG